MTTPTTEPDGRRVLRRCSKCRLLFEVPESDPLCVVCGDPVAGLALPLSADPVPRELHDREPTVPLPVKN